MEAKELRIGNYVQAPLGELMQVKQLGHKDYPDYIFASGEGGFGQNGYEGISLTPDILEKCGFIKSRDGYVRCWWIGHNPITSDFMMVIKQNDADKFFFQNVFHELEYLHELQNLYFALTKEELEINL